MFKKCLVTLLFLISSSVHAQIVAGASGVTQHTMGDDGYVSVPLQFGFPFYGKTFTHSFMFDNGVVGLYDPIGNNGCNPQNSWCGGLQWSAPNPNVGLGPQFNYMIAPLWADIAPNPSTRYYTQGTTEYQRYVWENIHEFYSGGTRLNTFGLELKPSGSIDSIYSLVNINSSNTFIGTIGNASLGEWNTIAYHPSGTALNSIPNWSIDSTGPNLCASDPLSSPACPGYAAAYFTQQCSINALFNPSCPGYAAAYFTQQCTANQLYNVGCPGYAAAYLEYQCSVNPLYSTTCAGYQQAYFNQQCSLNGLYNRTCPNYAEAYAAAEALKPKEQPPVVVVQSQTTTQQLVADPVVNNVLTTTATTAAPAASPAAPVAIVAAPQPATTTAAAQETKSSTTPPATTASTDRKDEPRTARQEIQERRQAAARAQAVEQGKNLANTVGQATSMEQQIAVQNIVLQAMAFTPGFDVYHKTVIPDAIGYRPFEIYRGQRNVDNRILSRGLYGPSDIMHENMVSQQYKN